MTLHISDLGYGLPESGELVLVATADVHGNLPRYYFEVGQILPAPDCLDCDATASATERADLDPVLPGERGQASYVECHAVSATGDF